MKSSKEIAEEVLLGEISHVELCETGCVCGLEEMIEAVAQAIDQARKDTADAIWKQAEKIAIDADCGECEVHELCECTRCEIVNAIKAKRDELTK